MLVTFTTPSHADITLFGSVATTLLKMMGMSGVSPGAIMAADVPDALQQLQAALVDQADVAVTGAEAIGGDVNAGDDEDDESAAQVPIATRAKPLIELLESAMGSSDNVMWSS